MDEINFALPKKPWNDDSLVNTKEPWFPMVQSGAKWISSIHSINGMYCGGHSKTICLRDLRLAGGVLGQTKTDQAIPHLPLRDPDIEGSPWAMTKNGPKMGNQKVKRSALDK